MELVESPSENHKFRIEFTEDEIKVLGAAYRELIFTMARDGELAGIQSHQAQISLWVNGEEAWLDTNNPSNIAEVLENFEARTKEAIGEIPMFTAEAPFNNEDIGRRYDLGQKAAHLAGLLRGLHLGPETLLKELNEHGPELFTRGADPGNAFN